MPRRTGVYFSRSHFVTKFGCGDGPPTKLAPAKNKSDREARKVAEEELRQLIHEREQNRCAPKSACQITVEDLVVKFLERTKAERQPATHHDYASTLRKLVYGLAWIPVKRKNGEPNPEPSHIQGKPFTDGMGDLRARDVTVMTVQEMRKSLVKLHSPKTVNNWLIGCKSCWNWGIQMNLVTHNPFSKMKALHAPGRTRICTNEEFDLRMKHADETFKQVLLFMKNTPVRPGVVRELCCKGSLDTRRC